MAKIPRTKISKYPGNNVPANSDDDEIIGANPIQDGKQLRITCFGASIPGDGTVALQLRTQVTPSEKWRTLRMVQGPGHAHYENLQPIVGDGTIAKLRMRRTNNEGSPQKINAWIEGIRR